MSLIFYIFLNHFCRHLIPYCAHKVSVFPKLASPQFSFHLRVSVKYLFCANTFQRSHYPSYRILRRYARKYMDMVFCHLYPFYLTVSRFQYLTKHFFRQCPDFSLQYPLAIFSCPYQVVFRVIYCMAYPFQSPASHYTPYTPLKTKGSPFLPMLPHGVSRALFS